MSNEDETLDLDGDDATPLRRSQDSGVPLGDIEIDLNDPEQCHFGAYTLIERIGGGGVGVVYRAHQASLERDVAIKLLRVHLADDETVLERFRFEARSAAALNHPNIVQILEVGQKRGLAFIAMQLVPGDSLAKHLREQRPTPREAVGTMLAICDAVGYAHRLRLLHLDLKPANVLVSEHGEPLVADFGLARRMDDAGEVQPQEVSGTPAYMAPEQAAIRESRLSAATDIYALGAILYQMLCGVSPHGRGDPEESIRRALAGEIAPLHQLARDVPRDLDAICMRCLSLHAGDRYPSVEALVDDLRRFRDGLPVSVRTPGRIERLRRWYAREPRFAFAITALLLLGIGGSAVLAQLYRRAQHERAGAEGIVRILMQQTPDKERPILNTRDGFRMPLIDCSLAGVHCNGDLDPGLAIDPKLPVAQRRLYVDALRDYVPKIAAWGRPRLAAQLAITLDNTRRDLYRAQRARAAAATGTADGLVFAWLLAGRNGDTELKPGEARAWLEQAVARVDRPWQALALALGCDPGDPLCDKAIARFQQLDPDNAAAWLAAIPKQPAAPSAQLDALLLRAAAAPRLSHSEAAISDAAAAFGAALAPRLDADARETPGEFTVEAITGLAVIRYPNRYCEISATQRDDPATQSACDAVYAKVGPEMSPWLMDEIVAATYTLHSTHDPAARDHAWQRLRDARWVFSAWKQLPPEQEAADGSYRLRMGHAHGELGYVRALVAKAKLPITAPPQFVTSEPLPWKRHPSPASATGKKP